MLLGGGAVFVHERQFQGGVASGGSVDRSPVVRFPGGARVGGVWWVFGEVGGRGAAFPLFLRWPCCLER